MNIHYLPTFSKISVPIGAVGYHQESYDTTSYLPVKVASSLQEKIVKLESRGRPDKHHKAFMSPPQILKTAKSIFVLHEKRVI